MNAMNYFADEQKKHHNAAKLLEENEDYSPSGYFEI